MMVNSDFAFSWINKTIRLAMMKQLATKETNIYNFKKVHEIRNQHPISYVYEELESYQKTKGASYNTPKQ